MVKKYRYLGRNYIGGNNGEMLFEKWNGEPGEVSEALAKEVKSEGRLMGEDIGTKWTDFDEEINDYTSSNNSSKSLYNNKLLKPFRRC